ncbi:alpha/beta hydrolase [Streptomyces sp. NPDC047017]|uniref:alpha/beta hydrolase n=1 Tax=Streptomyces sp. NPDC047017 TaxID=3155024 RepID=UPI0033D924F6
MGEASCGGSATPALRVLRHPPRPRAALLTLHGGQPDSYRAARSWHPAALRMRPVLRAAASGICLDETLLGVVRYRHRGWNEGDPLHDTCRALRELERLAGPVPVLLIGHSMGGRAALRAAGDPLVRGVVALAPWLPEGEPTGHLRGKQFVVVHGDRDTVTSPRASADYVLKARAEQARAGLLLIRGGDHAMLRRGALWHRVVPRLVRGLLTARPSGLAAASCAAADPVLL